MSDKFEGFPLSTTIFKDTKPEDPELAKHMRQAKILLNQLKHENNNAVTPLEVTRRIKTIEGVEYDVSTVFGIDKVRITPPPPLNPPKLIINEPVLKPGRKRTIEEIWEEPDELDTIEILWATDNLYYKMSDDPPQTNLEYYDINDYNTDFDPLLEGRKLLAASIPDVIPIGDLLYRVSFSILQIDAPFVGTLNDQGQYDLYDYKGVASYAPNLTREQFMTLEHDDIPWEEIDLKTFDEGQDGGWTFNVPELDADGYAQAAFEQKFDYPKLIETLILRYLAVGDDDVYPIPGLNYNESRKQQAAAVKMLVCDMGYARFIEDESTSEYFANNFGNNIKDLINNNRVMSYFYNSDLNFNYDDDAAATEMPEDSSASGDASKRRLGGLAYLQDDRTGIYYAKGYNMPSRPAEGDTLEHTYYTVSGYSVFAADFTAAGQRYDTGLATGPASGDMDLYFTSSERIYLESITHYTTGGVTYNGAGSVTLDPGARVWSSPAWPDGSFIDITNTGATPLITGIGSRRDFYYEYTTPADFGGNSGLPEDADKDEVRYTRQEVLDSPYLSNLPIAGAPGGRRHGFYRSIFNRQFHVIQDYLDYASREKLDVIERIGNDIGNDILYAAIAGARDPDAIDIESELIATYTADDEVYYVEADPTIRIIEI